MAATAAVGVTSDPYLNGVLSGVKWGVGTLTFSFPQDASFYGASYGSGENLNNFEAFTASQQRAQGREPIICLSGHGRSRKRCPLDFCDCKCSPRPATVY